MTPDERAPTLLDRALGRTWPALGGVALFSGLMNLLMLASPLYMMQVYDRVLTSGHKETLLYLTLIVATALLLLALLDCMRTWMLSRLGGWLAADLGRDLAATGIAARLQGAASGSQPVRDLRQVQSFLGGQGLTPVFDVPWSPVFLVILWCLHPWLGLLGLGAAVILGALSVLNELVTRSALKRANALQVSGFDTLEAYARNAEAVRAMGMMAALTRRFAAQDAEALKFQQAAAERGGVLLGISKFVRLGSQMAVLGLGALLVLDGVMTSGGMIAGSILLGRALAPVEQMIGAWKNLVAARASYKRLQALLRTVTPVPAAMALPAPEGRLSVEGLVWRPDPKAPPVLKGVSFAVEPGQLIGIIGPSGAGKSTLCQLLVGVRTPSGGAVRLDGAELHRRNPADVGPYLGYLPQDIELFPGTVAENVARMGDPDAEQVVNAAKLAGVHDLVLRLPAGYDTKLGDRGDGLSAGQRQRVGLARAVYGSPKLVVLDEPYSNLDHAGDEALQEALRTLKASGCTVLVVAHRARDLAQADAVLVLNDGTVQSFGPKEQVFGDKTAVQPARAGLASVPAMPRAGFGRPVIRVPSGHGLTATAGTA